jgi:hypothetical protein
MKAKGPQEGNPARDFSLDLFAGPGNHQVAFAPGIFKDAMIA